MEKTLKAVRILVLESNDSSISQIIEILKNNDFYIDCDKCVKVCPIDELDIKAGFDIRCVQCGLCESYDRFGERFDTYNVCSRFCEWCTGEGAQASGVSPQSPPSAFTYNTQCSFHK